MRLTIAIVALALSLGCTGGGEGCDRLGRHARYEPVVAKIRGLGLKRGEWRTYRLPNLDTESKETLSGDGAGTVWARMDDNGKLAVAIETIDHGHAGEYGFLFAEPGADDEGPGREWTRDCDLGGGWYSISCRLN